MHHFGMMTTDLERSIADFEAAGFKTFRRFDKQGMKSAMLFKDRAGVELIEFENPAGELEQKIKKHSAFVSDDLETDVQKFLDRGYNLAIPISDGRYAKRFAYVEDSAGNFIELIEPPDDDPNN